MLVPYTPCPMMGDLLASVSLQHLHCVVEEEVNQNGIGDHSGGFLCVGLLSIDSLALCPWMAALDLASDQLNAPNAGAAQLDLPSRPAREQLQLSDVGLQRRRVQQTA